MQPTLGGHDGRHPGLRNVGHISRARNKRAARVAAVVGVVRGGVVRGLGRDVLLGIPVSGAPLDVCADYSWGDGTLCNSADDAPQRRGSERQALLFSTEIHLGVNPKTEFLSIYKFD